MKFKIHGQSMVQSDVLDTWLMYAKYECSTIHTSKDVVQVNVSA